MKEAMEIMPETLEYGIVNANVLHFLRDVICQVTVDGGEIPAFLEIKASGSFIPQMGSSLPWCCPGS